MKTKAAFRTAITFLSIGFATLLFAPPSFGQGGTLSRNGLGQTIQEEYHGQDYVPEIGQKGSMNPTPTPFNHDIGDEDNTDLGKPMHDEDTTTVYDREGGVEKEEVSAFKGQHRGRITHGKRVEHFVVTKDSKPAKIRQTRDGSSDATESTGVFKDSLLDVASSDSLSLGVESQAKTAPRPAPQPVARPSASPKALPSASPMSSPKPAADDSKFELSLGIEESSPAPSLSH